MCQSVSLLSTAVGDVTPMHSPTLQTLHALIPFFLLTPPAVALSLSCHPPTPTLSSSLIPSSAPLSAFPSPHCSHSLILEPIDLQSEWANGARVDILQCDLGACKMRGESGGKRRRGWSVREKVWKEEGLSKESKTQMMYESLSGKLGAKMHTDWPAQGFRTFSQTFLITNLTGRDQMHQRDETQLSLSGKIVIPSFIVPVTCHHRLM